jgi:hypothetical protein
MFFHPTLRTITLSCLNFEADMDDSMLDKKRKSTPLKSLTLIECNVDVKFLDAVLDLPKALIELSIGERLHTFRECTPTMDMVKRTSSPLFLTALQKQAHSLKRLVHLGGNLAYIPPRPQDPEGHEKLRSLTNLEHLELGLESHLYHYLRSNGFPPSLKTLKMLDAAISVNSGDIRGMADVAFRSIASLVTSCLPPVLQPDFTVHLHFSDHSIFRLFVIANPTEQDRLLSALFLDRPAIYKIASVLKMHKARFLVSRERFPSGTAYIPPYMYGEELPVEEDMYDSNDYWRFHGINYRAVDDEQLREEMKRKKQLKRCVRCRDRNLSIDECRGLGPSIPCSGCARAHLPCEWEEEDDDDDDDDDDEEDEEEEDEEEEEEE